MIGFRKRSFWRAHALLHALKENDGNFGILCDIQVLLIKEIMRAEAQIKARNAELKALPPEAESRRKFLTTRVESLRNDVFIWKCFGDALAFLYMDKFALKHTFYSAHEFKIKQDAGFLSGKDGLPTEFGLVLDALQNNVPAMLTDLTTTIRHGDVALMGASDPYLVEVKAKKSKNERARKQKKNLEILHEFFENDRSDRLRGMTGVTRQANSTPERVYSAEMNACIADALEHGEEIRTPEAGLTYVVLRTKDAQIKGVFDRLNLEGPFMHMWNAERRDRTWAPYYPFTLTIENVEHLWAFVRGHVYILVFVGMRQLEQIAIDCGWEAVFDPEDAEYPLRIDFGVDRGGMRISSHLLGRIGIECVSPAWIITNSVDSFQAVALPDLDPNTVALTASPELNAKVRKYMQEAGMDPDTPLIR
ncbi:hypothetical protein EFR00_00425 [Rhizobium sophoriradicis]|uniref:hypothetical protein n=1 Tax=Rhizobium sophoriradicis TaxID=1535245 RepID=UPI00098EF74F|nr:hypothetical protein [Rhizobium sophoriradicis]RSC20993.1 hypothetical protein EFR00_00425 [Rhizobium sophoriradicis]